MCFCDLPLVLHLSRQVRRHLTAFVAQRTCHVYSCPTDAGGDKMSKKQRKMLNRLKIAELKQQCPRPDVVEVWDVTAQDPTLLVFLKVSHGHVVCAGGIRCMVCSSCLYGLPRL